MVLKRLIPCLLLRNEGLVKTVNFKRHTYIGDPINAVKIFNEKEVDELIFLDIDATNYKREPPYHLIQDIASECFMPFCYGGGVSTTTQIRKIIASGAEKIAINSAAYYNPNFIKNAVDIFGSSTIVASIDYRKNFWGHQMVYVNAGKKNTKCELLTYAKNMEQLGVGEIFLNAIEKDGVQTGFDLENIRQVSEAVSIPVIACGGAGKLEDFKDVFTQTKVSALAAGSFFVFQGKRNAVLISYPSQADINQIIT